MPPLSLSFLRPWHYTYTSTNILATIPNCNEWINGHSKKLRSCFWPSQNILSLVKGKKWCQIQIYYEGPNCFSMLDKIPRNMNFIMKFSIPVHCEVVQQPIISCERRRGSQIGFGMDLRFNVWCRRENSFFSYLVATLLCRCLPLEL